ncbi:MAG: glycosyltransferase [Firmicutes bacterium]|nr:glycosyltransferase [Bacillota bacterium]
MRVVQVITSADWGGAQRHLLDLSRGLIARGHTVEVLYGVPGPLVEKLAQANISAERVATLTRNLDPLRDLGGLGELRRAIGRLRPDLVHVHSSKAGALVRAALGGGPIPVVYTVHGLVWRNPRLPWFKRAFYRAVEERLLSGAKVTLVLSEGDRKALLSARPDLADRVVQIANGIDAPAGPHPLPSQLVVGTVARFTPEKALDRLVAAVAAVRIRLPDVRLLLVGDGPLRAEVERWVKARGLAEITRMVGFQSEVWPWLLQMRLFVLPSVKEGMPYALLEAMAARRLILATPVGAVPEVLRGYPRGRVVEPRDLAQACYELLTAEPPPPTVHLTSIDEMVEAVLAAYRKAWAES